MSIHSAMVTTGAVGHGLTPREENDFYATEPRALELLLQEEQFSPDVWECACGEGHLSEVLLKNGYNVKSTDLIDRGYGAGGVDFLEQTEMFDGDIVTNPPFKYAQEFIEKALSLVPEGHKVAMFGRIQLLEGQRRRKLYDVQPPKTVYVPSKRLHCAINGDFSISKGNAICFCWFVFEKGFKGNTVVKWIN